MPVTNVVILIIVKAIKEKCYVQIVFKKRRKKMEIKIKKLFDDTIIPTYGSAMAAGMDLYAHLGENELLIIAPHETVKVGTGIAVEPPAGYFGAVFARSGLATKQGLRPSNCVGVCDWDYRGEYIVALHNDSEEPREVRNGDRIAQLVFLPYITGNITVVDDLSLTERGDGGFGSSGK